MKNAFIISVPFLVAPLFGPTLGGFLIERLSWRWLFLFNTPLGLCGAWVAHRRTFRALVAIHLIPKSPLRPQRERRSSLDLPVKIIRSLLPHPGGPRM